jgi:hypothetical protein
LGREILGGKIWAGKFGRENLGGKIWAGKFGREKLIGKLPFNFAGKCFSHFKSKKALKEQSNEIRKQLIE